MAQRKWTDKDGYKHTLVFSDDILNRLDYLRQEIRNESISYGEIAELQSLTGYIDDDDVELLQWVGVEEGSRK